jgi:hypothetical protein
MRKFIIHVARDGSLSVMEVEIQQVLAVEDPSVQWLPEGEYRARVIAPASLMEKRMDGPLSAPIWHSHAFYWTASQAWVQVYKMIREELQRALIKHGQPFTEEDVLVRVEQVKEIKLP